MTVIERFESKYLAIPESGCWLWSGAVDTCGYGVLWIDGKQEQAHRVSWRLFKDSQISSLNVCHKCDIRSCVNPNHLFLGTQADNLRDAVAKGKLPGRLLSEDDIVRIRRMIKSGCSERAVARTFKVNRQTIRKIIIRVTYQ